MLSTSVTKMLSTLAAETDPKVQAERLKWFGRALLDAPADAAGVLEAMSGMTKAGPNEERLSHLLSAALDEARMARENGQKRGADFIDALEMQLARLVTEGLGFNGSLAASGAWVRAGLKPPESLAARQGDVTEALADSDPAELEALLDNLVGKLIKETGGSVSAIHAMFAEMLPTVPAEARHALVRISVARPPELYAELGCAWLLDPGEEIRIAAAEGLADRLAAGQLSAEVLSRLTILRSWVADAALRERLDGLIREAMRKGIGSAVSGPGRKLHRIVASLVDGSGAQSMAAAVQTGGSRSVAVVLLKQGFGVKDAYVLPCTSATDQRSIMATITDEIEARDVPLDYMAQAIGLALSEGLDAGIAPVPGLVDVAQSCSMTGLRPIGASVPEIVALADPEGRIARLPAQARGRLITASEDWEYNYPMLTSWFEDSDETVAALETATSRTGLTRGMWAVLEARRAHWAAIIARNALLLRAAGIDDADEFIAVAAGLAAGRDLKKTPVMKFICEQSIEVWMDRRNGFDGAFDPDLDSDHDPPFGTFSAEYPPLPEFPAEKKGELAKLLRPAGLTEVWLDGYLAAICTAPLFVPPPDWLGPLLHLVALELKSDAKMARFVELVMLRYNGTLTKLQTVDDPLVPTEVPLMSIWADGYLTAWEATNSYWPAKALGLLGKSIRKGLEEVTEGRTDRTEFLVTLPAWLRQRFAKQKI